MNTRQQIRIICDHAHNEGEMKRMKLKFKSLVPSIEVRINDAEIIKKGIYQSFYFVYAMLREITGLVEEVNPDARSIGTLFYFSLVILELQNSGYCMREIGVTCSGQKSADDNKTLAQARFTIGDYSDISIIPSNRQQAIRRGALC